MSMNVLLLLKKPNVDGGIYGISIVNIIVKNGHYGAVEEFFANLDDRNQNLLVERALEMYSGKKRIK